MSLVPITLSSKTLQFELAERRYLRIPMLHDKSELSRQLVNAVKCCIQDVTVFLYRDHDLDHDLDPSLWTIDVFTPVTSNEDVAAIESRIEAIAQLFPTDLLLSEVIPESVFLEIQRELCNYRV